MEALRKASVPCAVDGSKGVGADAYVELKVVVGSGAGVAGCAFDDLRPVKVSQKEDMLAELVAGFLRQEDGGQRK